MFDTSRPLRWTWGLIGLVVCAAGGCRDAKAPNVVPVTGTVRYQGKPLQGATVIFATQGATPQATLLALGTTDAQGRFQVATQVGATGSYPGAVAGTHRVTISKFVPPKQMSEAEYQKRLDAEAQLMAAKGQLAPGEAAPAKVQLLAPQFSDSQRTTLTAEVLADGENDFVFELK